MIVKRDIEPLLRRAALQFPALTLTGPRQSGKTTVCRRVFIDHDYVSLEPLDNRRFAVDDPRGFLDEYSGPVIIDEFQRAPGLASYIQEAVDSDRMPGRFILTGSQNLQLTRTVSQSLAGRTAIFELFPLTWGEIERFDAVPQSIEEAMLKGGFPELYHHGGDADLWRRSYIQTYVERDVRELIAIKDQEAFQTMLAMIAGRTAMPINYNSLARDIGVSQPTVRHWMSVIEAGYVLFRIKPWHRNFRSRQVKASKQHFVDTGIACSLLGIRSAEELRHHPLRGAIFETWVAAELHRFAAHNGVNCKLFHYRDQRRREVDIVVEQGLQIDLVEAKSGRTVTGAVSTITGIRDQMIADGYEASIHTVYGGARASRRKDIAWTPWRNAAGILEHRSL